MLFNDTLSTEEIIQVIIIDVQVRISKELSWPILSRYFRNHLDMLKKTTGTSTQDNRHPVQNSNLIHLEYNLPLHQLHR